MASQKRWTIDRFLPAYLEAAEKGMTREAFAESIGLKAETVYQRVYALRKKRKDIPMLRSAGKIPMLEQADQIMDAYKRRRDGASVAVQEPEKEPEPSNGEPDNGEPDTGFTDIDIGKILGVN